MELVRGVTPRRRLLSLAEPNQNIMPTALSAQRRILGRWTNAAAVEKYYFSTTPQKKKQELVIPVELVSDTL
jgi:hypothetical protein